MFDLGFAELLVVFVVALVVLGPQRMPALVSKVGRWVGKARSMARQFREQLENEVNLDELNKMTERQTKQATPAATPPIPPELAGEPPPLADSGYPYGSNDAAAAPAQPGDDTYSHAHAHGNEPMPYPPEAAGFEHAAPLPPLDNPVADSGTGAAGTETATETAVKPDPSPPQV